MRSRKRWPKGAWVKLTSADTLTALIAQRTLSYATLARYAGCSKGFVSHLTSGRRTTCTPQLAERIAEALQVPLELLFVPSVSLTKSQPSRTVARETAAA